MSVKRRAPLLHTLCWLQGRKSATVPGRWPLLFVQSAGALLRFVALMG